jgi:glutamine amidotransferase
MIKKKIALIDYGVGNLASIQRAFEFCGASVQITSKSSEVLSSDIIILPGVGSYNTAIKTLEKLQIIKTISICAKQGKIILGICLGMQLFFEKGYEVEPTEGLKLFKGDITNMKNDLNYKSNLHLPNIGWRKLQAEKLNEKNFPIEIYNGSFFYFAHSFMATRVQNNDVSAKINYGDISIPSFVEKNNIFGCQFHPEKSGNTGLNFIETFLHI